MEEMGVAQIHWRENSFIINGVAQCIIYMPISLAIIAQEELGINRVIYF